MTPMEWQEHAAKCREVAETIEDAVARRVLLEAADDYQAMARRESQIRNLRIPAFAAGPVKPPRPELRQGR